AFLYRAAVGVVRRAAPALHKASFEQCLAALRALEQQTADDEEATMRAVFETRVPPNVDEAVASLAALVTRGSADEPPTTDADDALVSTPTRIRTAIIIDDYERPDDWRGGFDRERREQAERERVRQRERDAESEDWHEAETGVLDKAGVLHMEDVPVVSSSA